MHLHLQPLEFFFFSTFIIIIIELVYCLRGHCPIMDFTF